MDGRGFNTKKSIKPANPREEEFRFGMFVKIFIFAFPQQSRRNFRENDLSLLQKGKTW
jgi:hypothetical protein